MLDDNSSDDLIGHIDVMIEIMSFDEDKWYVPLELAHQLREELTDIIDQCDE